MTSPARPVLPSPPVDDPFDTVQPIGQRPRAPSPTASAELDSPPPRPKRGAQLLSRSEQRQRRLVSRANRGQGTGHEPEQDLKKRHRDRPARAYPRAQGWTADEVLSKVTALGRKFYDIADDPKNRAIERKYAVTSFSTLVDKWTIVSGRPTEIHAFVQADRRAGVLELAARLASSAKASA